MPIPSNIMEPTTWGIPTDIGSGLNLSTASSKTPATPAAPATDTTKPAMDSTYPNVPAAYMTPALKAFLDSMNSSNQAKTIAGTQTSPGAGIVATSGAEVQDNNRTKASVTSLSNPDNSTYQGVDGNTYYRNQYDASGRPLMVPGGGGGVGSAQSASDAYLASLSAYQRELEQRRADQVKQINSAFDQTKTDTETAQKKETGTETATLARIGGYLGNSASGTGAMLNLAQTHQADLLKLENQRQAAVQTANQAIDDKEFDLAKQKAQEAKDIEKTINDRKQQFFQNSVSMQTQDRENQTANDTMYQNQLKALSVSGPDSINPKIASAIDSFYGAPGFTQKYVAATYAGNQAKTATDVANARKATLDLLKDIPAGKTVTFPDGTTYTGVGQAGDISTFQQTDNAGVTRIFGYNKITHEVSQVNLGQVGKASTTLDPVVKDNITAKFQTALESAKLKDGTYNPDVYLAVRQELKTNSKYPGAVADMDKLFLNPKNGYFSDAAIEKLRKTGIYYGDVLTGGGGSDASSGDSGAPIEGNQP